MTLRTRFALAVLLGAATAATQAATPMRTHCSIGPSETPGQFSLHIGDGDCPSDQHCGSSFSNESFSRFTGISLEDLSHEGEQHTATLAAEAGTFTCAGAVHSGILSGVPRFTANAEFVSRMEKMGFSGLDSDKLQAYAFLNVESAYARALQQAGIRGITTDNLIALRIFNVDPDYARSITTLGYELPDADKLIALRVQHVDAKEVREVRTLGYQPTLDELIQMRIFHVDPDFIRRMESRGLKNLTIAKLVQIRIFKLAE